MTSAFNLSQLANKVNTSGQVDATTGLNGIVPVANLGTGTANSTKFLRGDGSWASSSSTFLAKELPLKSGATLTAGRAVNINSSGEVGDYPVVNTLGTLVTSTTSEYQSDKDWTSTDGSRTLKLVNNAGVMSVRGFAITDTTSTAGGLTSLGLSGASGGGLYSYFSVQPINETQFIFGASTFQYNDFTAGTTYFNFKVITVDSSGNVSFGTANTFTYGPSTPWSGSYCYITPLPSGRFVFNCLSSDQQGVNVPLSRTASISGTTITTTTDTDAPSWYSIDQPFVTTNNKLIGTSSTDVYTCNYDGSTLSGSFVTTSIPTSPKANTDRYTRLISAEYGISLYQKSNNDIVLDTFSINQTTGLPTVTASYKLGNSTFPMYIARIIVLTSTDIAVSYQLGSDTYFNSIKLNSTANVIGTGINTIINSATNSVYSLRKSATNVVRYFYNALSYGNSRQVNINTYNTLSWSGIGGTAISQTTSPAEIVTGGICSGFTGLTAGVRYYVDESTYDGSVTATVGNYFFGTAISSTEILLG